MTSESQDEKHLPALLSKVAAACLHAFAETVGNLAQAKPEPDFTSFTTILTRPVATSLRIPISVSRAGIKALLEKASPADIEARVHPDVSPLTEEEEDQRKRHSFDSPHLLTSAKVLWKIGRAGRKCPNLHWSKSYTYTVGSDADPLNHPAIPEYLVPASAEKRENGTSELTLSFRIDSDWEGTSLVFSYQRWGGGKDLVFLDNNLRSAISGLGTRRMRNVHIILPPLDSGGHSITLRSDSSIAAIGYRVDQFMIRELPRGKNGKPTKSVTNI
jgi:hypothetical protein